jgi:hypothetical protein
VNSVAEAGTISVRLTANTAEFQKSIKTASDSVAKLAQGMKLGQLKQAFSSVRQAVLAIADAAPEVQASIDDLGSSWDDFLRKLGPGTKLMLDSLKGPLAWLVKMADKIAFGAGALGAYAGGGSYKDFKSQWDQDQNKIDFGGHAGAPESSSSTAGMMGGSLSAEKQNKWASFLEDFVWGGMEDAMKALGENGVGGFDFAGADVPDWADIGDSVKVDNHNGAMQSLVDSTAGKNFATTSKMIANQGVASNVGNKVLGSAGMAGGMIGNAMQGAAAAGPVGALASIATDLLTNSVGFQTLMESINPLLQAFSDLLGLALVILKPFMQVFDWLAKMIRGFVLGIYKLLDKIPGISFKKEIEAMTGSTKKANKEMEKTAKQFSDLNIPHGVKVALNRYQSISTTPAAVSTGASIASGVRPGINVDQVTVVANNPSELQKALETMAERKRYAATGQVTAASLFGVGD